jgi:hypothetical protein
LKPFQNNSTDSVTFAIKVLDWDTRNEVVYELGYKYGTATTKSNKNAKAIPAVSTAEFN